MQSSIKPMTSAVVMMLLIVISKNSFSQTSKFSVSLNSLTTNFNYGKSNAAIEPYKKNYKGLQAGFSYQAGITPMFSIVPEIYFAMKGGTLKEGNPLTDAKSTLRVSSIEMPVLARLHINRLYLNAGPYAGYNVGGRLKIDGTAWTSESITKLSFGNADASIKRWDFGFQAGAGYNFKINQSTLTLDVRYGYGLTNISKDVERYNRMLNISVLVTKPGKTFRSQSKG